MSILDCGGCKFQNLSYDAQLEFKQKQILDNLKGFSEMTIPKISRIKKAKFISTEIKWNFLFLRKNGSQKEK